MKQRFVGITVMPEFIATEGVTGLLDNIARRAGANAVATSPYVMEPADAARGTREPPADAGAGSVRLLDRALWGRRELFVRTAPSYQPDLRHYHGLRYQPAAAEALTKKDGHLVGDFIRAAKGRGLKVYLQVQAAIPPGYRVQFGGPEPDDVPLLPNGRAPARRVDKNGSLASPHIRDYGAALLADLAAAYPEIDGFRVDWPEYPPYTLDDWFLDFSEPALAAARKIGIDTERMRADAMRLYDHLTMALREADLVAALGAPPGSLAAWLARTPGMKDLFRLKAALVDDLLASFRASLDRAGARHMELMPNAFPPPWSSVSGFDYGRAARHSSSISVKLYTMHWPMMLGFAIEALRGSKFEETAAARLLARLLDTVDGDPRPNSALWTYPGPDEPHPVGLGAQTRKIAQARAEAGETPINALAHSYGPVDDFRQRLKAAWNASDGRVWINRYGYLSDAKLDVVREVCA